MRNTFFTIASSAVSLLATFADASALVKRIPGFELTGYTYSGCYTANVPPRLSVYVGTSIAMTLNSCAIACKDYTYFGVTLGTTCVCGNSITPGIIPALDTDPSNLLCQLPCVGNVLAGNPINSQYCGGAVHTAIFSKNAGTVPPVPSVPSYNPIGCYSQATASAPLIDASLVLPAGLTIQTCEALCASFRYYGLQSGGTCTCGNTLQPGAYIRAASDCNTPCNGNGAQQCGGSVTVNIFAQPSLAECGNLGSDLRVKNPGFENGVAFWTTSTATPTQIQWAANGQDDAHTGRRLARIVSKTTTADITLSQSVPACPGAGYILSIWRKEDTNSGCTATVAYNGATVITAPGTATWTKAEVFVLSAIENNLLGIAVSCTGSRSPRKMMYIDDVQLRPATIADSGLFPGP